MNNSEPILYIIATPIGNLEDITLRALRILREEVDILLCEDTRTTGQLLKHYDINLKTESYHAQSNEGREDSIIERMQSGVRFGLVSDAGTPTISDPGTRLVQKIRHKIPYAKIIGIPGASALITALSVTGFDGNQFVFYGFLPHKKGRKSIFDEIETSHRISIFYESPHRLLKTLEELSNRFGNERNICVARELTKIYEESPVMGAADMHQYYLDHPEKIKGECVILIDK